MHLLISKRPSKEGDSQKNVYPTSASAFQTALPGEQLMLQTVISHGRPAFINPDYLLTKLNSSNPQRRHVAPQVVSSSRQKHTSNSRARGWSQHRALKSNAKGNLYSPGTLALLQCNGEYNCITIHTGNIYIYQCSNLKSRPMQFKTRKKKNMFYFIQKLLE